jgi:hypothetical protein
MGMVDKEKQGITSGHKQLRVKWLRKLTSFEFNLRVT